MDYRQTATHATPIAPSMPLSAPIEMPVAVKGGWFETIKLKLNPDQLWITLKDSKETLIAMALYFGFGFLVAFLLRRFSIFFITLILVSALFLVMQQFDVMLITINWQKVYSALGLQATSYENDLLTLLWQWIQTHLILFVSFLVGFLIGLRFG